MKRLLVLGLSMSLAAAPSSAQTGVIDGVAVGVEDSSAIAHALVRLQQLDDTDWLDRQQRITSAVGRYRFLGVAPGRYRVQLLRIGYRPVMSDTLQLEGSDTARVMLRATAKVVELPAVKVSVVSACLTATNLSRDAPVAELWREARLGAETRRAFENQHSFRRILRQEVEIDRRIGGRRHQARADTLISIPDSVQTRDRRRQARNREQGYAAGGTLTLPDEKEILDDAFLTTHCVETRIDEENGALGLRFRPVDRARDGVDLRGRIWIEARSHQVRRLELEYLRGGATFGEAAVDYSDVDVGGGTIRLPRSGDATVRPAGIARSLVKGARATFAFTYDRMTLD